MHPTFHVRAWSPLRDWCKSDEDVKPTVLSKSTESMIMHRKLALLYALVTYRKMVGQGVKAYYYRL